VRERVKNAGENPPLSLTLSHGGERGLNIKIYDLKTCGSLSISKIPMYPSSVQIRLKKRPNLFLP